MRRGVRRAVLGAALVVLATTPASGATLRIVTLNLYHGGPASGLWGDDADLERRLAMVARELRALGPDIVALQEASWGWRRRSVAARLADALGFPHHVYVPTTTRILPLPLLGHVVIWAMNFSEGPAVLSRYPIVEQEVHDLPRCVRRWDPRVLLRAEVRTPSGRLEVYSTHTSRDDCQLARIAEVLGPRGDAGAVLAGDLNTVEQAPGFRALLEAAGLVDAFRAANPATPGPTVWQRIRAAEPTVSRRVDYVLVRAAAGGDVHVLGSRVILNRPEQTEDGPLWPSDHYGVMADVEWVAREGAEAPPPSVPQRG
ncbi:MAG: endonuclease/exonuclease/phosphatase family protein [Candidatus Rokubacteria bacterium]|nr:endonuclease/exonuclease/phosphatase family protein [Candidatus Rokubacteria bacterium]